MTERKLPENTPEIRIGPAEYDPARAPIYAANAAETTRSAATVWSLLVRAKEWPNYYPHASEVSIEDGADELSLGIRFRWKTAGIFVDCNGRRIRAE